MWLSERKISILFKLINSVYADLGTATQDTVKEVEALEERCENLYYAEAPKSLLVIPPNTALMQKAGYLFLRR